MGRPNTLHDDDDIDDDDDDNERAPSFDAQPKR